MADLARLNVCVDDMTSLLSEGGLEEHSMVTITTMKDKKQHGELLDLLESFMECMAFVDHNKMTSLLLEAWRKYMNVVSGERKVAQAKYDAIKEDKKAEADKVATVKANLDAVLERRGAAMGALLRLKAMDQISIEEFKKDKSYDATADFDGKADKDWYAWNK